MRFERHSRRLASAGREHLGAHMWCSLLVLVSYLKCLFSPHMCAHEKATSVLTVACPTKFQELKK